MNRTLKIIGKIIWGIICIAIGVFIVIKLRGILLGIATSVYLFSFAIGKGEKKQPQTNLNGKLSNQQTDTKYSRKKIKSTYTFIPKRLSIVLNNYRFNIEYSKHLKDLKAKIKEIKFENVEISIKELNLELKKSTEEYGKFKKYALKNEYPKLDKFLSSNQTLDLFYNGTNKRTTKTN